MSRPVDPSAGKVEPSEGKAETSEGVGADNKTGEDEGRAGGGKPGAEQKTASKGINPVQHSE
jgi:hypothetical protein